MLLTPEEVAEQLRISKSFVYKLIREKELPSVKIGRAVRVPKEEIDKWIRKQIPAR